MLVKNQLSPTQLPRRIWSLDILRGVAIIMMLFGHFMKTTILPSELENSTNLISVWLFIRGLTAPLFFTISGVVISYILQKAHRKNVLLSRSKKNIKRVMLLLIWGYALRFNPFDVFSGQWRTFLATDVLHCVAISILFITLLFQLKVLTSKYLVISFAIVVLVGMAMLEPVVHTTSNWFPFLSNYVFKGNGSVFTIIPWLSYSLVGYLLGYFLSHGIKARLLLVIGLLGVILWFASSAILIKGYDLTQLELLKDIAYNNYIFERMGQVLLLLAGILGLEKHHIIQPKDNWLAKTGRYTLLIYVLHCVILFGSFTGIGIFSFYRKSLNSHEAFIGGICFATLFILLIWSKKWWIQLLIKVHPNSPNLLGKIIR